MRPALLLTTFPDEATAKHVVRALLAMRLVAGCNIFAAVPTIYSDGGAIVEATEAVGLMRTADSMVAAVQEYFEQHHPDIELVSIDSVGHGRSHAQWVLDQSSHSGNAES